MTSEERLERLAEKFRWFAEEAAKLESPLWERVSQLVAAEPRLLDIADEARPGVQQPNMLLSAFHYLLLDLPTPPSELLSAMSDTAIVSFMLGHEAEMRELIRTRLVQTNEVRRCALFLPAFVRVAADVARPLALLEVGTSAGLLLGLDRYGYRYEPHIATAGDPDSPVQLTCELRGEIPPSLALADIAIASRVGIDLYPVRTDSPDDVKWLRALTWPEHDERRERLAAALDLMASDPYELREGDAFELLPAAVREVPTDVTPVVFHCMTLAHMPGDRRREFPEMLSALAAERQGDLAWIACEYVETDSLHLTTFAADGSRTTTKLANVNPHGAWMEWLAT